MKDKTVNEAEAAAAAASRGAELQEVGYSTAPARRTEVAPAAMREARQFFSAAENKAEANHEALEERAETEGRYNPDGTRVMADVDTDEDADIDRDSYAEELEEESSGDAINNARAADAHQAAAARKHKEAASLLRMLANM